MLGQLPRVTNHSNCVTPTSEHVAIPSNKESDSICSYKGMGPKGIDSQFPYSSLCKTGSPDVCWFPNLPINSRNIILAMDLTFWCCFCILYIIYFCNLMFYYKHPFGSLFLNSVTLPYFFMIGFQSTQCDLCCLRLCHGCKLIMNQVS